MFKSTFIILYTTGQTLLSGDKHWQNAGQTEEMCGFARTYIEGTQWIPRAQTSLLYKVF